MLGVSIFAVNDIKVKLKHIIEWLKMASDT